MRRPAMLIASVAATLALMPVAATTARAQTSPAPTPSMSATPTPASTPVPVQPAPQATPYNPFNGLPDLTPGASRDDYRQVLQSPQYLDGHGRVVFVYQTQHPFVVPCAQNHDCEIILDHGETLPEDPQLPPPSLGVMPWHLHVVTVNNTSIIHLTPDQRSVETILQVDTDRHHYTFDLVPQGTVQYTAYTFTYPGDDGRTIVPVPTPPILATPPPDPAASEDQSYGPPPQYTWSGSAAFYPISVQPDAHNTIRITLPIGAPLPAVGTFESDRPDDIEDIPWTVDPAPNNQPVIIVLTRVSPIVLYTRDRHGLTKVVIAQKTS